MTPTQSPRSSPQAQNRLPLLFSSRRKGWLLLPILLLAAALQFYRTHLQPAPISVPLPSSAFPTAGGVDNRVFSPEAIVRAMREETQEAKRAQRVYPLPKTLAPGLPEPQDGLLSIELNGNIPDFEPEDLQPHAYESYSLLDQWGRVGPANAVIGRELLPRQKRGDIHAVYPSGWKQKQYACVPSRDLYTRSHLLAHQLSAEDANFRNLMTGTQSLNQVAMLPFEEKIGDYVRRTGGHVRYRVTPIFVGSELVARGLQLEARSIEDGGRAICFNVYLFNTQPGVVIDYQTGKSYAKK